MLDARLVTDEILAEAMRRRASDVHLEPTQEGYEVRYRIDGLLETVRRCDTTTGRALVTRLMVMAQLLTYRLDIPQEGRLRSVAGVDSPDGNHLIECRVAVMPTSHGLRAAVRMPADLTQPKSLEDLGLPSAVLEGLRAFAAVDSGMLIVTGPAGSGKTTTNYALLEHLARTSTGASIVSLEDPVERDLPGVTQIEVSAFGQMTYERALRSILRQDPQVLMLGEIRDAATASLAVQAALSGHRLICTLHAARPGGAIARLLEMGIEPYQLTSAIYGILAQRLLRKRTDNGYRGRLPVAEFARFDAALRQAVLRREDAESFRSLIEGRLGYTTLRHAADDFVVRGLTDREEVLRVLGPEEPRHGEVQTPVS